MRIGIPRLQDEFNRVGSGILKILAGLLIAITVVILVGGCGAVRSLTTRNFMFAYDVGNPPAIDSPVGTPAGHPLVVTTHADITDDLVKKFDKFHGGIDWAGMKFRAELTRGNDVNLKLLASLTPPTGSGTDVALPADASLIEDITLTSALRVITRDETTTGAHNEALRKFIADTLNSSSGGNVRVYIYFEVSSSSGGRLVVTNISINGKAHGSMF